MRLRVLFLSSSAGYHKAGHASEVGGQPKPGGYGVIGASVGGQGGQDFGQGDGGEAQDFGQQDDGGQGEQQPPQQPGQDMAKSFGLPVFRIEA